jgi:glycosyltransferase involved in cell wall biosynthesis
MLFKTKRQADNRSSSEAILVQEAEMARILMTTSDHLMIDRRILQEAQTLTLAGHVVTILAGFECASSSSYELGRIKIKRFAYDWSDRRFVEVARKLGLVPGTRLHYLAARTFNVWAARSARISSFDQFVIDRMLIEVFDVIHAHDFPMLAAAVEVAKTRNVPLLYDAHELYYAQIQLPPHARKKYKSREKRLIKFADVAVTVNPHIAKLMAKRYHIPSPRVILNAAPLQPVERTGRFRDRFGLTPDTKIVMYQGWISANRGIETFVEAAEYLPPGITLAIVGYGDFESSLKAIVEQKSLQGKVFFFGGVPSDQLHEITCEADLGVIPYIGVDDNNYFCSPNKLFEFTVASVPFISNDLPFLADIIRKFGNGVARDITTPKSMALAIAEVVSDASRLERLGKGAALARQSLNWETEAKKLIDIYSELIPLHDSKDRDRHERG